MCELNLRIARKMGVSTSIGTLTPVERDWLDREVECWKNAKSKRVDLYEWIAMRNYGKPMFSSLLKTLGMDVKKIINNIWPTYA